MFKTLVARGDRKVETVPLKDVLPLTGYVRGGVTVLGARKAYPVFVDETVLLFEVEERGQEFWAVWGRKPAESSAVDLPS